MIPPRDDHQSGVDRRTFFTGIATLSVAFLAGCSGTDSNGSEDYDGWLDDVPGFDGTVDLTETERVAVTVGADGGLAFDPIAIRVDVGTTVVWEWSGHGGYHDVKSDDGVLDSGEYTNVPGHTYEHAFDREGTYRYYCSPHRSAGMKGVVEVV